MTCWGDNASVVAFEVSVLSAKAYCERILCTHLNGDNGHHFLSIHSRIGLSHRNESFVYKFVSWMILGRFTNFGNPLSLTPPRLPMCILSYLLQIRYTYIYSLFFIIKANLHFQPAQMPANSQENLFKFKSRSLFHFICIRNTQFSPFKHPG